MLTKAIIINAFEDEHEGQERQEKQHDEHEQEGTEYDHFAGFMDERRATMRTGPKRDDLRNRIC